MTETTVQITKPMLSGKAPELEDINYPVGASPKLDGIRALMVDGKLVSRTFKPIRNTYIREQMEAVLPDGIDGELMAGTTFQDVTSSVMRESGEPEFTYFAFDYVKDTLDKPYTERMQDLKDWFDENQPENVTLVLPKMITTAEELHEFEAECLSEGYEGVMVRSLDGRYKCGRATTREGLLMKVKRFDDAEAVVVGYEERMHNMNEAKKDAFGRTERSQHQENKVPAGDLGKLILRDPDTGIEFGCGTGFSQEQREQFWAERDSLVGKIVKYKSFRIGVKEAPRHPVFLGFRDVEDM